MSAYVIAEHEVLDLAGYNLARPGAAAAIRKYGGRYLVNGLSPAELIEGSVQPARIVLLEFPDMDVARRFYASEEYRAARATRQAAARSRLILVNGVTDIT